MRESASSRSCLIRPTTPTTVSHGVSGLTSKPPERTRFPERVLAGPELPGQGLVHDDDPVGVTRVVLAEEPPGQERDLHRPEVVPADDADVHVDEGLAGRGGSPFHGDGTPRHHLAQGKRRDPSRAGHARQTLQALQSCRYVSSTAGGSAYRRPVMVSSNVSDVGGVEARRHLEDAGEAADEEARSDEQHNGQRELARDQEPAQAVATGEAPSHARRSAPALRERPRGRSRRGATRAAARRALPRAR